jgi:predicted nuclease with TOPRIM domain
LITYSIIATVLVVGLVFATIKYIKAYSSLKKEYNILSAQLAKQKEENKTLIRKVGRLQNREERTEAREDRWEGKREDREARRNRFLKNRDN